MSSPAHSERPEDNARSAAESLMVALRSLSPMRTTAAADPSTV